MYIKDVFRCLIVASTTPLSTHIATSHKQDFCTDPPPAFVVSGSVSTPSVCIAILSIGITRLHTHLLRRTHQYNRSRDIWQHLFHRHHHQYQYPHRYCCRTCRLQFPSHVAPEFERGSDPDLHRRPATKPTPWLESNCHSLASSKPNSNKHHSSAPGLIRPTRSAPELALEFASWMGPGFASVSWS